MAGRICVNMAFTGYNHMANTDKNRSHLIYLSFILHITLTIYNYSKQSGNFYENEYRISHQSNTYARLDIPCCVQR